MTEFCTDGCDDEIFDFDNFFEVEDDDNENREPDVPKFFQRDGVDEAVQNLKDSVAFIDHNTYLEIKNFVCSNVYHSDLLVLLMEECSELAQAASKMYRALNTPGTVTCTVEEATNMMKEEAGDVLMLLDALAVDPLCSDVNPKWKRWEERVLRDVYEYK